MDLRGPELIAQALLYAPGKIRTCGLRIRSDSKGIPYSFPVSTFFLLITRFAGYFMGRVFPILRDRILLATIQKLYTHFVSSRLLLVPSIPEQRPSVLLGACHYNLPHCRIIIVLAETTRRNPNTMRICVIRLNHDEME